jgi:GT2 family glycosyltransferase
VTQAAASVWIVVPNFNGRQHLERCLPTLMATQHTGALTVIVVDDGSTDGSIDWVRSEFPGVRTLPNAGRKGFAGSSNTGIRLALEQGAEVVGVCNSDTRLHPDWLVLSLPALQQWPRTGLVGFLEVTPDRESQFTGFRSSRPGEQRARQVPAIPGCLMLFSSACLRHVGLFDEDFFMYGEDNDMFLRLRHAGWHIAQVQVPVWHFAGGASRDRPLSSSWLAYRNALRYALKNESTLGVMRVLGSLANQGLNPFASGLAGSPSFSRLRQQGILVNLALLVGAVAWNTAHLRKTWRARRERAFPP